MNRVEKKNTVLISLGKVSSKIGNIIFDYANVMFLANKSGSSMSLVAFYQASEAVISIFLNLFGGVIADNYNRKKF